jgi:hypothetical protein
MSVTVAPILTKSGTYCNILVELAQSLNVMRTPLGTSRAVHSYNVANEPKVAVRAD